MKQPADSPIVKKDSNEAVIPEQSRRAAHSKEQQNQQWTPLLEENFCSFFFLQELAPFLLLLFLQLLLQVQVLLLEGQKGVTED